MTNQPNTYYCFTCDAIRLHHLHPEIPNVRRPGGSYLFPAVRPGAKNERGISETNIGNAITDAIEVTDEIRRIWEAGFEDGRMLRWDDALASRDKRIREAIRATESDS